MDVYLSAHGNVSNDKIIMVPKNGEKNIRVHFLNILGYITYVSPLIFDARDITKIKPFLTIHSGNIYPEMNFHIYSGKEHKDDHTDFIYMIDKDKKLPICLYEEEIIEKYFKDMQQQDFYESIPVPKTIKMEKSNYIKKYYLEQPFEYKDFKLLEHGITTVLNFYKKNKEFKIFYDKYLEDLESIKKEHKDFCNKFYNIGDKTIKDYNDDDWKFLIPNEFNEILKPSGISLSTVIDKIIEKHRDKEIDLYIYSCAGFEYTDTCQELSFLENIDRRKSLSAYHLKSRDNPRRYSTRLGKWEDDIFNFEEEENYVKNFKNINLIDIVNLIKEKLKLKEKQLGKDYVTTVKNEVNEIKRLNKKISDEWSKHFVGGKMDEYLTNLAKERIRLENEFKERGYEWHEIGLCNDLNKHLEEIKKIYSEKTPVINTADICRLLKFYNNINKEDKDILKMFVCLQENNDTPLDAAFGTVLALAFGR